MQWSRQERLGGEMRTWEVVEIRGQLSKSKTVGEIMAKSLRRDCAKGSGEAHAMDLEMEMAYVMRFLGLLKVGTEDQM